MTPPFPLRRYRDRNRSHFHLSFYFDPFGWNYRRYNVGWRLTSKGKSYKIADVRVLGFSLVYLQRGLFTSFLSKRDGDIGQLVAALDR